MASLEETLALYEQLLRLCPAPQLRKNCNVVLAEGISSVSQAVDDVTSAFAKLEEVRDAVTKLQSGSAERSASLVAAVESTTRLQAELNDSLKQFTTVNQDVKPPKRTRKQMKIAREEMKHSRDHSGASSDNSGSESEDEAAGSEAARKQVKKAKTLSCAMISTAGTDKEPESKSHLVTAQNGNCDYSTGIDYNSAVKEVDMLPVHDRIRRMPELLRSLEEEMASGKWSGSPGPVVSRFNYIMAWVSEAAQQQQPLDIYFGYLRALQTFSTTVVQNSSRKVGLLRRIEDLALVLDSLTPGSEAFSVVDEADRKVIVQNNIFRRSAENLVQVSSEERAQRMDAMLKVVRAETAQELSPSRTFVAIKTMKEIVRCFLCDAVTPDLLVKYQHFATVIRIFACRVANNNHRNQLRRLSSLLSEWLETTPDQRRSVLKRFSAFLKY